MEPRCSRKDSLFRKGCAWFAARKTAGVDWGNPDPPGKVVENPRARVVQKCAEDTKESSFILT